MNKSAVTAISLLFMCAVAAESSPISPPAECTTRARIWHETTESIPPGLNEQQAREAITGSLQQANVPASEANGRTGWDWRYEYQDDDAIYAGLTVRSHYLRVAIVLDTGTVSSIICDSRNLNQSRWSIHRNVSIWKAALDDDIRIALRRAAEPDDRVAPDNPDVLAEKQAKYLDALFEWGILTKEEHGQFMQRVTEK